MSMVTCPRCEGQWETSGGYHFCSVNSEQTEPFATRKETVERAIAEIDRHTPGGFDETFYDGIRHAKSVLRAMLSGPKRKEVADRLSVAMFGHGDRLPDEVFDKMVDVVMEMVR